MNEIENLCGPLSNDDYKKLKELGEYEFILELIRSSNRKVIDRLRDDLEEWSKINL